MIVVCFYDASGVDFAGYTISIVHITGTGKWRPSIEKHPVQLKTTCFENTFFSKKAL